MGGAYPELGRAQALIEETLKLEETRFRQTLERGLRLLDDEVAKLPEGAALPGEAAFRLYDTYGFPLDLTQDALRERGRAVDTAGFDAAMAEQRAKARASWAGSGETQDAAIWFDLAELHGATEFLGYDTEESEGQILALVRDGKPVEQAGEGDEIQIVQRIVLEFGRHPLLADDHFVAHRAQFRQRSPEIRGLDPKRLQQRIAVAHSSSSVSCRR
jgi:alanyl-tRNA synthetase